MKLDGILGVDPQFLQVGRISVAAVKVSIVKGGKGEMLCP